MRMFIAIDLPEHATEEALVLFLTDAKTSLGDEIAEGHAGADKNRRAPQDVRVAVNNGRRARHSHL